MKIGIIGGGQLGRMLALAGHPLGMRFVFLDPAPDACAAALGEHLCADYSDLPHLRMLAEDADAVTLEFENAPADSIAFLSQFVPVHPGAEALRVARDRWLEKSLFAELGVPTPPHANIESQAELQAAVAQLGLPAVLKTRQLGYDGKGQKVLRTADAVAGAYAELGNVPCLLERFIDFTGEVSLLAVRGRDGETRFYPLVHNTHREGILRLSVVSEDHPLQALAEGYAHRVLDRLDYVGVLAFEFFEIDGGLMANEIAPRVHNSGHWTIEGAECSQFENHLRAVAGLPLGSTAAVGISAMINFIGALPALADLTAIPECHPHFYDKAPKPGRKVGHATVRATDRGLLEQRISAVEALI